MPVYQGQQALAAATTVDNLMTGSQYLYMPWPGLVRFGLVGDANAANYTIDIYTGADVIAESMEPSAANHMPIDPDDFSLDDVVGQGELIKIRIRNKHASTAGVLFYCIKFLPV